MKFPVSLSLLFSFFIMGAGPKKTTLTEKEKQLIVISSLTAVTNLKELKSELNKGLDAGLTINEINEALAQLYAYCGFPRSLQGITTFMEVVKERKAKGLNDPAGKSPSPIKESTDKY